LEGDRRLIRQRAEVVEPDEAQNPEPKPLLEGGLPCRLCFHEDLPKEDEDWASAGLLAFRARFLLASAKRQQQERARLYINAGSDDKRRSSDDADLSLKDVAVAAKLAPGGETMLKAAIKVGPADHGRPMSLAEFDHAEVQEGHCYELGRGVIVVSDVPKPRHLVQVAETRIILTVYKIANPNRIYAICSSGECKLLIPGYESERHPDLAIYKTLPPEESKDFWFTWVPELVIEVVSRGSELRDYQEKREEYRAVGVREYWILDADKQQMLVLQRIGKRWRERIVRPPEIYQTRLLPGLQFACEQVFQAAKAAGR
jgi:Uma2 family endonuclease